MFKYLFYLIPIIAFSCSEKKIQTTKEANPYKTKNAIIVVVDGPRYSETWGDPTHQHLPHMANDMAKEGTIFTNFYNDGFTYTNSGHSALTTGFRQEINNTGKEFPKYPSIMQYYLKETGKAKSAAWVITTKDKLEILANTNSPDWKDKYLPATNCGINGNGTGYRDDKTTLDSAISIMKKNHPSIVVINFKEPDASGHANNWPGYLKGIEDTDGYVYELFKFIQTDTFYKDKTAFFVTNDHGRHLNGVKDGFVNHGCPCEGCRHINLFAYGVDFPKNKIVSDTFAQQDIPATIAQLFQIQMPHGEGKTIVPLLNSKKANNNLK